MKTSLYSRVRRHLSYANVMASIAVFLAFGGVGYAAATISGKQIVNRSIGAGKLKNGTLTSSQVKKNALTGAVIDESSLEMVPQAQTAVSATTAASASTAAKAELATKATTADSATTATTATTAGDADTVDGVNAAELRVGCPAETELFGGMCWDEAPRTALGWIIASSECGKADGRLPTLSELIAYVLRPGGQFTGPAWTSDVLEVSGGDPIIATHDEVGGTTASSPASSGSFGYRCLFYRVN